MERIELAVGLADTINLNDHNVIIDKRFIDTIKNLNKKGYTTLYCCSGHTRKEEKRRLKEIKKRGHERNINRIKFIYENPYILFDKKYNFNFENIKDIVVSYEKRHNNNYGLYFKKPTSDKEVLLYDKQIQKWSEEQENKL